MFDVEYAFYIVYLAAALLSAFVCVGYGGNLIDRHSKFGNIAGVVCILMGIFSAVGSVYQFYSYKSDQSRTETASVCIVSECI